MMRHHVVAARHGANAMVAVEVVADEDVAVVGLPIAAAASPPPMISASSHPWMFPPRYARLQGR